MTSMAPTATGARAFLGNLWQGLRMLCLWRPQAAALQFSWGQLLALLVLNLLLGFAFQYAYVGADGVLQTEVLPEYLAIVPEIALAWALGRLAGTSEGAGRYLIALFSIGTALIVASPLVLLVYPLTESMSSWIQWLAYYSLPLWYAVAAALAAVRLFEMRGGRAWLAAAFAFTCLMAVDAFLHSDRWLWSPPSEAPLSVEQDPAVFALLNEDSFYRQPQLLASALAALQPERPGHVDLYFIGAAGYAAQGVFMREVNSVTALFDERFDTKGRSIRLINNPATAAEVPIFSGTALKLALTRIAALMNRDEDVLFLFMTSHGSSEHRFALDFGAMSFKDVDPPTLRRLLDESGIKRRVIVISACYSGGFVEALKDDNTLVITAAAADRNSFGCSNENDYTYFGKAYFDEALRKTHAFTEAFEMAKPVIAAREKQDDYKPSEPQISLGKEIVPVLQVLSKQRQPQ